MTTAFRPTPAEVCTSFLFLIFAGWAAYGIIHYGGVGKFFFNLTTNTDKSECNNFALEIDGLAKTLQSSAYVECSPDASKGYFGRDYTLRITGINDTATQDLLIGLAQTQQHASGHIYTLDFLGDAKPTMEWVIIKNGKKEYRTGMILPPLLRRVYLDSK